MLTIRTMFYQQKITNATTASLSLSFIIYNIKIMKLINLLITVVLLTGLQLSAQIAPDKYYIQFSDKNNSPYSIDNPEEFLTQRSLDRRSSQGISIQENDIPVNPQYLQGVSQTGANLLFATRWFNGVTVETTDPAVIEAILNLPYVSSVLKMKENADAGKKDFFEKENVSELINSDNLKSGRDMSDLDYGFAYIQINQINGIPLHNKGFKGEGMVVAVLDGGFDGADVHPVFDSLWNDDRVLGTKDFIHVGGNVFTESEHGKMVLSTMAANDPGNMIGTAPKASYWLLRSEDVYSENLIEEYNWVSAAEFADSVGADMINSSLSYVDFDMPQWNHNYEDLDGNTAVVTIGADLAFSKGIFVCNSAGNSGGSDFPWNGAPADGFDVFSIGAIDENGNRAYFSSIGPTADGRIRPVVMAMGSGTTVAVGNNGVSSGSGTSFSSPIITGMTTCLWQANPNLKVSQIQEAIKQSASNSTSPNNLVGWGTPDYELANSLLTTVENFPGKQNDIIQAWPNPFSDVLNFRINLPNSDNVSVELSAVSGVVVYKQEFAINGNSADIDISLIVNKLPNGIYFLKVLSSKNIEIEKLIKK